MLRKIFYISCILAFALACGPLTPTPSPVDATVASTEAATTAGLTEATDAPTETPESGVTPVSNPDLEAFQKILDDFQMNAVFSDPSEKLAILASGRGVDDELYIYDTQNRQLIHIEPFWTLWGEQYRQFDSGNWVVWSADGQRIAIEVEISSVLDDPQYDVCWLSLDGPNKGCAGRIGSHTRNSHPAWDGTRLYFEVNLEPNTEIYRVFTDSGRRQQVSKWYQPHWAPISTGNVIASIASTDNSANASYLGYFRDDPREPYRTVPGISMAAVSGNGRIFGLVQPWESRWINVMEITDFGTDLALDYYHPTPVTATSMVINRDGTMFVFDLAQAGFLKCTTTTCWQSGGGERVHQAAFLILGGQEYLFVTDGSYVGIY